MRWGIREGCLQWPDPLLVTRGTQQPAAFLHTTQKADRVHIRQGHKNRERGWKLSYFPHFVNKMCTFVWRLHFRAGEERSTKQPLSLNNAEDWFWDVNMINSIMYALVLVSQKKPMLNSRRLGGGQHMIRDRGLFLISSAMACWEDHNKSLNKLWPPVTLSTILLRQRMLIEFFH